MEKSDDRNSSGQNLCARKSGGRNLSEGNSGEGKFGDGKLSDGKLSEGKLSEGKLSEGKFGAKSLGVKNFILFCISIFLALSTTACTDKPGILFNTAPITKENIMDITNIFEAGQKIYYMILIPKPSNSRYAYIQIIKKDNDYDRFGYDLYWSNTVRLKDEQMYYYDDYVVINQKGSYVMQVYLKDKPQQVYTMSPFYIN